MVTISPETATDREACDLEAYRIGDVGFVPSARVRALPEWPAPLIREMAESR